VRGRPGERRYGAIEFLSHQSVPGENGIGSGDARDWLRFASHNSGTLEQLDQFVRCFVCPLL
jgi:hypothetical protein